MEKHEAPTQRGGMPGAAPIVMSTTLWKYVLSSFMSRQKPLVRGSRSSPLYGEKERGVARRVPFKVKRLDATAK